MNEVKLISFLNYYHGTQKKDKMYKLNVGKKGLFKAAELKKGYDIAAGYTERKK